jgi:hypothetical protein
MRSTLLCSFEWGFGFIHRYLYDKTGDKFAVSLETIDPKTMEWTVLDIDRFCVVVIESRKTKRKKETLFLFIFEG